MAGYIGTKAVNLSTTGADINGNANVDGTLDVTGGDVSFYEDTGATVKFLWDASAESLTLSGSGAGSLTLDRGASGNQLKFENAGATLGYFGYADGTGFAIAGSDGAADVTIDASGNVGIGITAVDTPLHVSDGTAAGTHYVATFVGGSASTVSDEAVVRISTNTGGADLRGVAISAKNTTGSSQGHDMLFYTNAASATPTERMRIDASGNVGIGTASPGVRFVNKGAVVAVSPTLGSGTNGQDAILSPDGKYGLYTGVSSNGDVWQQVQRNDGVTTAYNMLLQPSGGNVGIGTSSPIASTNKSVIAAEGAWGGLFQVQVGSTFHSSFGSDNFGSGLGCGMYSADGFTFYCAATTGPHSGNRSVSIDASGNVLVGTATSRGRLTVESDSGSCRAVNVLTGTATVDSFTFNGAAIGSITTNGVATAYNTSSDYRLKDNITLIQGASDIVKSMRPVTYTYKADGSWMDGFIAHELQELHPVAVTGSKDAMQDEEYEVTPAVHEDIIIPAVEAVAEVPAVYDDEGVLVSEMVPAVEAEAERTEQQLVSEAVMGTRSVPDYQGVDYSKLTPILTAALKEALDKIDALEARLTALEATP